MPETKEVRWNHLTAAELNELAARGAVVLVSIGSTEQHGPHLPTGVDDFMAAEVCRRAAMLIDDGPPVIVAPSIPFGLAEHHMLFGGTLTLSLTTLHALLRDLCRSIDRAGFSGILIVNGHGGTMTALHALTTELTAELNIPVGFTNYFAAGRTVIREILETQDGLMHACEGETSMIMAALPELVRTQELDNAVGPAITLPAESTDPVYFAVPFRAITESGVAGNGNKGTAEKGERLLDGCAQALADALAARRHW
ncbi:creatininase family protein [Kibdelosporangium philippinense]|uniref:Creatininase family protein n=1 Tax=Kibdelosporangium philippinense TaxID=211113 RepID=A0ABS8ZRC5_9PSEU|nr:creatininase family protein [Kibdelosporangium philippinense]MCE7010281.1 creatininase family protein [Kibdelosporangium philippinense]